MKIAHFAIFSPHAAGLYETTKELIQAERLAGLLRVTSGAAPPERPFYEHPAILVGAGVVVGAAVTTLTYKITRTP